MPAGESDDRAKTRERFNQVLKKYTEKEKKKTVTKKNPETQETIVLQSLKKNLNLVKNTEDDETVLKNTYDPERGSPRYTKNQRRETELAQKVNNDSRTQLNTAKPRRKSQRELPATPGAPHQQEAELEPDENGDKEPKRKSKKGRSKADGEVGAERQLEAAGDELLQEYQQQIAAQEERSSGTAPQNAQLNNHVGKKKKKKLKSVVTESDGGDQDEGQRSSPRLQDEGQRSSPRLQDEGQGSSPRLQDEGADVENETESKGKKKKKKKKHVESSEAEALQEAASDDSLVLGVLIHRTDGLQTDLLVSHPMVKVHVVDELTGQYVKKQDCHRHVSSFYERESVEHILPIMTQPFDFRKKKSTVPEWQEQIIFNERFGYFIQQDQQSPKVILFFEILDFVSMEEARANVDVDEHERGFRKIAWAFLKLVGTNGVLNIDSKLRLQLYCRPHRAKRQANTIEVVEWWRKYPRTKYASTLFVTVKGIKVPEHVDPGVRSMMALQEERGSTSYSQLQQEVSQRSLAVPPQSKQTFRWSRLPGQVCRIPNKAGLAFRGGQMGCFTLLFSHAGTMLAAACADRDAFPVVVYEIPSGKVLAAFNGHFKIVYDLCWSRDDGSLLSASSDGTVREWDVQRLLGTAHKVLPHPSFVYCARYHPAAQNLVLTGGYDGLVRVWRIDVDHVNGQLLQEFEAHRSFINTLCFDTEGSRMFSADHTGRIVVWKTPVSGGEQRPCSLWEVEKTVEEAELHGVAVNMLQLHPNGRCLLVHARDSVLRVIDLRILAVKKYIGATNHRERVCSTFTPCGSFIFSGSEDGMAYVWNADTGDQVAVYSELSYPSALHGVTFHPHENMVAFCALARSQPIQLYLYDRRVSQLELHSVRTLSRCVSLDTKTLVSSPDPVAPHLRDPVTPHLRDPVTPLQHDQYSHSARLALKMQCVQEQLDSVLEPGGSSAGGFSSDTDNVSVTQAGRRRPHEAGLNASLPPSLLSPHSKVQLNASLGPRGFSPVGQRLIAAASSRLQSLSEQISAGVQVETDPVQEVVVSLYDYTASRSDELSIRRGDAIQVLYKDNHTWWFGRLQGGQQGGQQGYFLASYVVDQSQFNEEPEESHPHPSETAQERSTPTRVSAVISSSGELQFLSEPTLSDTEPELSSTRSRRKRKVKKAGVPGPSGTSGPSGVPKPSGTSEPLGTSGPSGTSGLSRQASRRDAVASSSRVRMRSRGRSGDRPLPERPTGRTNGAFQPDP